MHQGGWIKDLAGRLLSGTSGHWRSKENPTGGRGFQGRNGYFSVHDVASPTHGHTAFGESGTQLPGHGIGISGFLYPRIVGLAK